MVGGGSALYAAGPAVAVPEIMWWGNRNPRGCSPGEHRLGGWWSRGGLIFFLSGNPTSCVCFPGAKEPCVCLRPRLCRCQHLCRCAGEGHGDAAIRSSILQHAPPQRPTYASYGSMRISSSGQERRVGSMGTSSGLCFSQLSEPVQSGQPSICRVSTLVLVCRLCNIFFLCSPRMAAVHFPCTQGKHSWLHP